MTRHYVKSGIRRGSRAFFLKRIRLVSLSASKPATHTHQVKRKSNSSTSLSNSFVPGPERLSRRQVLANVWRMDANHRYLGVGQGSLPLDHGTIICSRGGNRTHNLSPGSRPGRFANLRTRPIKLRRPDLNRRRTAYETVLETRLQSTPQ